MTVAVFHQETVSFDAIDLVLIRRSYLEARPIVPSSPGVVHMRTTDPKAAVSAEALGVGVTNEKHETASEASNAIRIGLTAFRRLRLIIGQAFLGCRARLWGNTFPAVGVSTGLDQDLCHST